MSLTLCHLPGHVRAARNDPGLFALGSVKALRRASIPDTTHAPQVTPACDRGACYPTAGDSTPDTQRTSGVIGHFVLLGLVPGVVVGGGVVEFVEADCVAPAGDDAGGLVGLAGVVPGIFEGCVGGHGRQDPRCWLRVS